LTWSGVLLTLLYSNFDLGAFVSNALGYAITAALVMMIYASHGIRSCLLGKTVHR